MSQEEASELLLVEFQISTKLVCWVVQIHDTSSLALILFLRVFLEPIEVNNFPSTYPVAPLATPGHLMVTPFESK